ncbi:hypothetical protein C9426_34740 [Serratia sp. S1B]|nr:hypothetical protein C9426_34740 [Serratia sp. S1B]
MNQTTISNDDIARLEHLRNVGDFVTDMAALQTCYEKPLEVQQEQLVSLIFLMTEQLDGVVQRCYGDLMCQEVVQ